MTIVAGYTWCPWICGVYGVVVKRLYTFKNLSWISLVIIFDSETRQMAKDTDDKNEKTWRKTMREG